LDVKTDGPLKVKRRTLVITSYETRSNSKGKIKDEEQPSSHLVTVQEANDLKAKNGSTDVLEIPENVGDFQHGPTSSKFLKCHFLEDNCLNMLLRTSLNCSFQNQKKKVKVLAHKSTNC